jgi:hypothetical protein
MILGMMLLCALGLLALLIGMGAGILEERERR